MAFPINNDGDRIASQHIAKRPTLEKVQRALENRVQLPKLSTAQANALRGYQARTGEVIGELRKGLELPKLPSQKLLPRSGWEDQGKFSEVVDRSRQLVRQAEKNWRRRSGNLSGKQLPTSWRLRPREGVGPSIAPMYGMPMPDKGERPPSIAPMYGMPMPDKGERPPSIAPMYGMPMPDRGEKPPSIAPMYGMPMPGPDFPDFPDVRPMYGLPMPPIDKEPDIRPMYGMPHPIDDGGPDIRPMYGMPRPIDDEGPDIRPMYGMPRPIDDQGPDIRPMYGLPLPHDEPDIRPLYGMPIGGN